MFLTQVQTGLPSASPHRTSAPALDQHGDELGQLTDMSHTGDGAELNTVSDVAQGLLSRDSLPMTSAAKLKPLHFLLRAATRQSDRHFRHCRLQRIQNKTQKQIPDLQHEVFFSSIF